MTADGVLEYTDCRFGVIYCNSRRSIVAMAIQYLCRIAKRETQLYSMGHKKAFSKGVSNLIFVDQNTGSGFSYSTDVRDFHHDENSFTNDIYGFFSWAFFKKHPNEDHMPGIIYFSYYKWGSSRKQRKRGSSYKFKDPVLLFLQLMCK